MPNRIPKVALFNGRKYHLFDVQQTKPNAEYSGKLYAKKLPGAEWLIKEYELGKKPKRYAFGIYSTKKVSVRMMMKKVENRRTK